MLPKYEVPRLTVHRLTDDIMNTALEQMDLLHVTVQTAREVCYMYMSHAAVWDEELAQFQTEAAEDMEEGSSPMDVVAALSDYADDALMWEDIRTYRQQLKEDDVEAAMKAQHISGNPKTMVFLLAAFVVGGHSALAEYDDILEEEGISKEDVVSVKEEMEKE